MHKDQSIDQEELSTSIGLITANEPHEVPSGDAKNDIRITRLCIVPRGEPIFDERSIHIEIVDNAAGEFLKIHGQTSDNLPEISPEEWPVIKSAIDFMVDHCRSTEEMDAESNAQND